VTNDPAGEERTSKKLLRSRLAAAGVPGIDSSGLLEFVSVGSDSCADAIVGIAGGKPTTMASITDRTTTKRLVI
jgi:hypothetical protein